ncbi:MAG TPA: PDZ domain-containing protein [Burkholderiaceae bacterium]|nr:PDZ domain-containing protein [Burkholderiaceae bacterium]
MTIRYAIRPADPGAHLFHVTVTVDRPDPEGQLFALPAWNPGSYMIREFARHIVRLTALAGQRKLRVEKLDKHTWRCAPTEEEVTLAYEVYAFDLSVRAAYLDPEQSLFNGAAVFVAPIGRERDDCRLDIFPPAGARAGSWRLTTGLAPARGTRAGECGTYLAHDYDELIDCPVQMGRFAHRRFEVHGVQHEIAIGGRVARLDLNRLQADLTRLCEAHVRLFEPRRPQPPFGRYAFLTLAVDEGYGGLEHRNSSALICRRDDLPYTGMKESTEGYRRFLGLVSHEYFHAWNVKRIRPQAFVPYDLARENYTRLLWVFEGFTAYYDDLMLARAGLMSRAQYLDALGRTMSIVMQRSARLKQSLAESSFDAWIKYYRQDENAPNSVVSYYQKGSLVALALDLSIRHESGGRRSLDDLMRWLWRQWRTAGASYEGVGEDAMVDALRQSTGLDLSRAVRVWAEGTRDPDFAALLQSVGIRLQRKLALESPHFALLGLQVHASGGGDARVGQVFDGGPAQQAGLAAGDILMALDDLRVTPGRLDALLARYSPGDVVQVLAFRREELQRFELRLARLAPPRFVLEVDEKASDVAKRRCHAWCGERRT